MKKTIFVAILSISCFMACKQDAKKSSSGDAVAAANPKYVAMRSTYNTAMKGMEQVAEMQTQFREKSRKLSAESNMQTVDPNVQFALSQLNKAENSIAMWAQQFGKVRMDTMKTDLQKELFVGNGSIQITDANSQINLALDVCKKVLAGQTVVPAQPK